MIKEQSKEIDMLFEIKTKIIRNLLDIERYDLLEQINEMSPNEIILLYMTNAPIEEYVIEAIINKLIELNVPF